MVLVAQRPETERDFSKICSSHGRLVVMWRAAESPDRPAPMMAMRGGIDCAESKTPWGL